MNTLSTYVEVNMVREGFEIKTNCRNLWGGFSSPSVETDHPGAGFLQAATYSERLGVKHEHQPDRPVTTQTDPNDP